LRTIDLEIGFPDSDQPLFSVPDLLLRRGACAALIGPNGAGKSTFLKTLLGEIEPFAGEVRLGASLQVGYFAQAHEGLRPDRTVLQEILEADPRLTFGQARDLLGRFLFSGDDVEKRIEVLSGGERGRVALAQLTLQGANLLLLDEPTNHLDLPSQELLQAALAAYPGTILLVSHDRYLIEALADPLWVIEPPAQVLRAFAGGYRAYVEARQAEKAPRASEALESNEARDGVPVEKRPTRGSNRIRSEIEACEREIAALEQQLDNLAQAMQKSARDPVRLRSLGEDYERSQAELERWIQRWEALSRELEAGSLAEG
jgi:ATP-binding cassette subfamily F protein 3